MLFDQEKIRAERERVETLLLEEKRGIEHSMAVAEDPEIVKALLLKVYKNEGKIGLYQSMLNSLRDLEERKKE